MNFQLLIGTWRSYKAFYALGSVKKHSTSSYLEVTIDKDQQLTIKMHPAPVPRTVLVQTTDWQIKEVKDRFFLFIVDKQLYEVVTLDRDDLVLADTMKGEKIFFAQLSEWRNRMYMPVAEEEADVSITIWSNSLIELIQE